MQNNKKLHSYIKLHNNIKIRSLIEGNKEQALKTLLTMTLVAPKNVEFLAELALMEASEGKYKLAIDRLDNFIKSFIFFFIFCIHNPNLTQ